ncbi:hypothetical protein K7432_006926 [Basidiobolus ranarum]|uniref:DUF7082 domain-containing protein n=1 Tax=Basidiobolus ranarum TaxID=34480 RepID=A0ABR2W0W4_9FUNG
MISPHSSQPPMHPFYSTPPVSVAETDLDSQNNIHSLEESQQQMPQHIHSQTQPQSSEYYFPNSSSGNYIAQPTGPVGAVPMVPYNAYASLLNKASLNLTGNIDDMALNWTDEEKEAKRRLVQFWRQHKNNVIHCGFQPVAPAERGPNSIVVSCIYWEEKKEFFITSVDCIYLLESLIAVRFTVEEKNRIRRNLEGFRPLTVSKCKPESAEFFKLIMSFPNPKPRNIEKDVKVFPWKVLPYALKKIIGKYTASYSSTVSVNMDTFNGTFSPNSQYGQQGYNPQFNRPRFYSQDLGSMANQTLASASGPGGLNFGQNASNVPEPGQNSPHSVDSAPIQSGYSTPPHGSHHTGPQRRHLYLRRHSLADPYTLPYNQPRRHSLADVSLQHQQQQYRQAPPQQHMRGYQGEMYSSDGGQFPPPQLLLSSGLNPEAQNPHPFPRETKGGILGGNYGGMDGSGNANTGYGDNNVTHGYEPSEEYTRGGRGQRFAPMATINQAQEMSYSNFDQNQLFGERQGVSGGGGGGNFQASLGGGMGNSNLPPNAAGAMPLMGNAVLGNNFPGQEPFMMGSGEPDDYQQH